MMSHARPTAGPLEPHRSYLRMLAGPRISPALRARIDPSDIVQQTLLTAHEKFGDFRGSSEPELRGWLRAILANQLADALRRLGRRPGDRAASLEAALDRSSARIEAWLVDSSPSPSRNAIRAESLARLADSLAALPDDQRQAIEFHHLHGLSVPETARRMGRSAASAAGLLRRGAQSLRESLRESE